MTEVVIIPEGETPPAVAETEIPTVTEIVETAEALAEKMVRSSDETGAILIGLSEIRNFIEAEFTRIYSAIEETRRELSDMRDALESAEEEIEEIEEEVKIETEEIAAEPAPVEPPPEFTPPQPRKRKWI